MKNLILIALVVLGMASCTPTYTDYMVEYNSYSTNYYGNPEVIKHHCSLETDKDSCSEAMALDVAYKDCEVQYDSIKIIRVLKY